MKVNTLIALIVMLSLLSMTVYATEDGKEPETGAITESDIQQTVSEKQETDTSEVVETPVQEPENATKEALLEEEEPLEKESMEPETGTLETKSVEENQTQETETESVEENQTQETKPEIASETEESSLSAEKERRVIKKTVTENASIEATVPIYVYDIVNVVAPTAFRIALNPYEFPVKTGNGSVSTAQVVSKNYGIINKSSLDKIVTVTLTVEDLNVDKIKFVDSAEEAQNADAGTYAVYLSAMPSDGSGIKSKDADVGLDTTASALSDVSMKKAEDSAVTLHAGTNRIAFKLSKAVYDIKDGEGIDPEIMNENKVDNLFGLVSLAADGSGATAFTFDGVLNKKADWSKLSKGIRITAEYTYETADGSEEIVDGTGAMIQP